MKKKILILPLVIFIFFSNPTFSQLDLSSEVGLFFGITSFQTDFGESKDFPSENAASMGFGAVHYLNFFSRQYSWRRGASFFTDHFKLRTEFLYTNKTNIRHEPWVGLSNESVFKAKLDGMRGNIKLMNIGNQLEFYFRSLEDNLTYFGNREMLNPYISIGIHYSFYDPEVTTNYSGDYPFTIREDLNKWYPNPEDYPEHPEYTDLDRQTIYNESSSTFGVSLGAGLRYNMQYFDVILDTRWQHFFTDQIDGLDAPNDPGNKNNDTMIFLNLGVVYTFNYY